MVRISREKWADGATKGQCSDCATKGRTGVRLVKLTGRGDQRVLRCRTCEVTRQEALRAARSRQEERDDLGLTLADRRAMRAAQHGLCWICGPWTGRRGTERDHDHVTGRFRGYLCIDCNYRGIGRWLRDNIIMARRVVTYLEHPPAQDVIPDYWERDWSPYRGKLRRER